ncbi:unnamed protein product [Adineta steineri]|uniref:Uncharacterized protein n=1 Tax=Adineta steineri TaxID=433720 RepID=A0A815AUD5_9BILA|nr:unnamed protein product [Adineta steineri]CAF1264484.1 unnamed protein product [Adineta steineri]
MAMISMEFTLVIILILFIFIVNIFHILYLIIRKNGKQFRFFRSILINSSFSSLIIALWLIPFFYFRIHASPESLEWRLWSFTFHIVDAVQLYSLLLLVAHTNFINLSLQRFLIGLSWLAPIITYSPLLWLSSSYNKMDHLPFRRLSINIPWWILPTLYSSMYLVPIFISFVLIGIIICWPWIYKFYKKRENLSQRQTNEHRENMAELTSLVETVLSFELDQSTMSTINTWLPSISSSSKEQTSLSDISTKLNRSLSYKVSQDHSSLLFDDLSSSSIQLNNYIEKAQLQVNYYLLFIITCLLLFVHMPYAILSLMDIYTSHLPIFIYIHWFGTLSYCCVFCLAKSGLNWELYRLLRSFVSTGTTGSGVSGVDSLPVKTRDKYAAVFVRSCDSRFNLRID